MLTVPLVADEKGVFGCPVLHSFGKTMPESLLVKLSSGSQKFYRSQRGK
jgi:hypothetical protein